MVQQNTEELEQKLLREVSRSFALTIPELPPILGRRVTNAYLLCRIVDTIEDETALSIDQKREYFCRLIEVLNRNSSVSVESLAADVVPELSDQTLPAEKELLAHTADVMRTFFSFNDRQQAAIRRCIQKMAMGMLRFQAQKSYVGLDRLSDMDAYCYYVAGVVGEMLTELFCTYSTDIDAHRKTLMTLAPSFGQGLQMTNILKDLWDDHAKGACWLPREIFERYGFDLDRLSAGDSDSGFHKGLVSLIGITRYHLSMAMNYAMLIPSKETGIRKFCLWAIGMAVFTLRNINRNPDYKCGLDVKISRRRTKSIILVSNASVKSNHLLKMLFAVSTFGLPNPDADVRSPAPGAEEERLICGERY